MNTSAIKRHLKNGGIIAYPTESCFGLGCDPRNRKATKKILRLKQRPQAKGVILVAAHFEQLQPYLAPLTAEQTNKVQAAWPGAHTWLIPAHKRCPVWITGQHPDLAVRVTAHVDTVQLCKNVGMALVSTSANKSGGKAARTARDCYRLFGSQVRIVAGRVGKQRKPSTIQALITGNIIRS
jgi:L-threonylcarbamoyladenylate synthase